jgi:hypothetical protein
MKKSLITLALLIGIFATAFAENGDPKKKDAEATPVEKNQTLTADEQVLLTELEAELEISLEQMLEDLTPAPITKVVVYDLSGKVLQEQAGKINLDQLPKGANLLMTEGQTQYYLVN